MQQAAYETGTQVFYKLTVYQTPQVLVSSFLA